MSAPTIVRRLPKEYRRLAAAALAAGWAITHARGGHARWSSPCGQFLVYTSASPSDRRALANARARLRRAGVAEGAR